MIKTILLIMSLFYLGGTLLSAKEYVPCFINGKLFAQVLTFVIIGGAIWFYIKLFTWMKNKFMNIFFKNQAKETIKTYLFWVDFVEGITSPEVFKKKLKKIKNTKVYKCDFDKFYLTYDEARTQSKEIQTISIQEVLESETYPFFLMKRLNGITHYSKEDLKYISRKSQVVWMISNGLLMHLVLKDATFIYPKDYPQESEFKYGYTVIHDKKGLMGVYDVQADKLVLGLEYTYIITFGDIAILSHDNKKYHTYNLVTSVILDSTTNTTSLDEATKQKIDLSKMELQDYLKLFDTPQTQQDLERIGLWGAHVYVVELPSGYEGIIKDSRGTICWYYPVSANMYDMSMELPVNFEKNDGSTVTLGIDPKHLILEPEYRQRLTKLQGLFTSEDTTENIRILPNYLKIKKQEFNAVDFSHNTVDSIRTLDSDEFNELVSSCDSGLLFTYLSTVSDEELQKFYKYSDEVVQLSEEMQNDGQSAKEQIQNAMSKLEINQITDAQRARATLEMPLMINFAKNIYTKIITFQMFSTYDYYQDYVNDIDIRFESTLSTLIWKNMSEIPEYFEQVLTLFRDFYDENNSEHQKIFIHLSDRFGKLIGTLDRLVQLTQDRTSISLAWFVGKMLEKKLISLNNTISIEKTKELTSDKKLINFLTLMFTAICDEDEDNYLENIIYVTNTLFEWYPVNREACEYAMVEMMKSVAIKKVNVENANAFLDFFAELPRFYKVLSYEKIIELKTLINHTLVNEKPQDNEIFNNPQVKRKLILLNYLIDMEDLYYENVKNG